MYTVKEKDQYIVYDGERSVAKEEMDDSAADMAGELGSYRKYGRTRKIF